MSMHCAYTCSFARLCMQVPEPLGPDLRGDVQVKSLKGVVQAMEPVVMNTAQAVLVVEKFRRLGLFKRKFRTGKTATESPHVLCNL